MKNSHTLLIILCLLLFLTNLNYLFVDIMEARNFVTAREMVDDGNWIFTTMNGEPRYQKPPLPTWLSAGMAEIFGTESIWALRFPAALSCVVLIFFFYKFIKKETDDKSISTVSTLILITTYLVLFIGKRATWDIYCYSFTLIGIYFFYLTIRSGKRQWLNFTLAGLFLGLSILSKGPTGIYVIGAPFFLAYWIAYGFPKIKWGGWAWIAVLTVIVGFSWYGYIYLFDEQTLVQTLETESGARTNREVKPFTRYFSFPIQMGVWAVLSLVSLIFPYVSKKTKFPKAYKFFFWWTIICFILLSLIPSKKERYLFPLMIPLAATTGFYVYYLILNTNWKNWERWLVRFVFGLTALIAVAVPVLLFGFLKVEINFYSISFSFASLIIGIYIFVQTFRQFNVRKTVYAIAAFVASAMILGIPVIDKLFYDNPGYKSLLTQKEMIENSGLKLYGIDAYSPEIWFKYGETIPEIYPDRQQSYPKENEFYLITMNNGTQELDKLKELGYKTELIGEFDDNEQKAGTKNHVDRKKMILYKVMKF